MVQCGFCKERGAGWALGRDPGPSPALLPERGSSPSSLHHTNSGLRAEVHTSGHSVFPAPRAPLPRALGFPSLSLSPAKTFPCSRASALFSAQLENNGAQLGAKLWPGVFQQAEMSAECSNLEEVRAESHSDRESLRDLPTPPLSDCGSVSSIWVGGWGSQMGTGDNPQSEEG